jgi:hypothetical protein
MAIWEGTVELSLPATRTPMSISKRLALFGAAAALGSLGGLTWNLEGSVWLYTELFALFTDPTIRIAGLAAGLGVGFLLGFLHITSI